LLEPASDQDLLTSASPVAGITDVYYYTWLVFNVSLVLPPICFVTFGQVVAPLQASVSPSIKDGELADNLILRAC
jgi:hypothetical protein